MPDRLRRLLQACGEVLQGAFGTDAYARYRAHHASHHPGETPKDRATYFREQQRERWEGINRCC